MSAFQMKLLHCALYGLLFATMAFSQPTADNQGICASYVVQYQDTCESIAKAHGITVAEIEKYNANTLDWDGCDGFNRGKFICLSGGYPPMPVALPQATCGPQVPGTPRPSNGVDLASLNPCLWGACCVKGGYCAYGLACLDKYGAKPMQTTNTTASESAMKTTLTKATSETTTETITTTKTQSTTTTSATPTTWTLVAYSKVSCEGDYYMLEGPTSKDCVDIRSGLEEYSDTGVSCRYYTDGGFTTSSCDNLPEIVVLSHHLSHGSCLMYEDECQSSGGGYSAMITSWAGCTTFSPAPEAADNAIKWRSLRCTVTD